MDDAIEEWEHAPLPVVYFVGDVYCVLVDRLCGGVGARHVWESGRACFIHVAEGQRARGRCPCQTGLAVGCPGVCSLQGRQEVGDATFS